MSSTIHGEGLEGVDGLRIADASILPRVTTGNTMVPCVVIGERAAALLPQELPRENAQHQLELVGANERFKFAVVAELAERMLQVDVGRQSWRFKYSRPPHT